MMSAADGFAQISALDDAHEVLLNNDRPYAKSAIVPKMRLVREPGDAGRVGDYFAFNSTHYFSERAVVVLGPTLNAVGELREVEVLGLDRARYFRFWLRNVCDCLDLKATDAAPPSSWLRSKWRGKIGVIRTPRFNEQKWDGSMLFKVPQDPSNNYFAARPFVDQCTNERILGMLFVTGLFGGLEIEVR